MSQETKNEREEEREMATAFLDKIQHGACNLNTRRLRWEDFLVFEHNLD